MEKIVLIDGHSILNRAFYGVPDLTNSEGLHVNAIYGFLNILFMIIEEEKPEYLTVAFDVHAPTFRHEIFSDYKGTRSPMAPELREQVPVIKEVLKAMNINVCTLPGYEADDVLGTIAKKCQADGLEVALVSGDRDLLQISDEHIKIRIPKTKGGKTQIENYYPEDVVNEYQVTPHVFIDMKALMGDNSDNVKGVTGVGPKSAAKLLITYGSLDGIYDHLDEMKPSAMKENLIRDKEQAYLARKLVTILTDAPVDFSLEDAVVGNFFNPESYTYFKKLEFKNYLNKFDNAQISNTDLEECFVVIEDLAEAEAYFNSLHEYASQSGTDNQAQVALYIPNKNNSDSLSGFSYDRIFMCYEESRTVSLHIAGFITEGYIKDKLDKISSTDNIKIITYNCKELFGYLDYTGIEDKCFDVILAAYLLDPLKNAYDYEYLASLYLGMVVPSAEQITGKKEVIPAELDNEKLDKLGLYITSVTYLAEKVLRTKLKEEEMDHLLTDIEMPLAKVLSSMENVGVRVDPVILSEFSVELGKRMDELSAEIFVQAGEEFNILSPKQLGVILFEKLGLKGGKKTKTGYSTSADVLEKIKDNPLVGNILEYRAVSKLKSTYADGLSGYIDVNNRIHSKFQQTVTATGRLSSTDPNLQNIPTRTELGQRLREAFIPSEGRVFVDADYSQIELRILAHIAGDEELLSAYAEGRDIHAITASRVFGIPLSEVTAVQRRNAKAVNFGIVYGISSYGLSEDLSISQKEAAEYIAQYFVTFPGIKKYLDESVKDAKEKGYVSTLYGRKRVIPELSNSNFMVRQFGERVAMNSPIQGTAADIMKIAMINVYRRLQQEKLDAKIVLQVHDELLIDVPEHEVDKVCEILKCEMENAADLSVSLEVDMHVGKDWLEAK